MAEKLFITVSWRFVGYNSQEAGVGS